MEKNINTDTQTPIREKYTSCAACDVRPGVVLPHFHDAIEVIFTTSGFGTAICNGVKYQQTPGSVFFAAPNEIHYFTDRTEDTDGLVIDIEPMILRGSAAQFKESTPVAHMWEDPAMENQLWDIVKFIRRNISENRCTLGQETLSALTTALLSLLLDCVELEKTIPHNATITQVLNYCQEHCTEPISLDLLSQELGLSVSHISRIFSKKLKISFSDYINGLRLNTAVNLMNSSKITVTKAAAYAGFPTIRTFNRVFMDQYGMTPSQYRKEAKKE